MALVATARQAPSRADSLFDAAGWKRGASGVRERGGKQLSFELLTVGSSDNAIEQLIQSDLSARGVRMEIRQIEGGAFLTAARAGVKNFDALIAGIPGDVTLSYLAGMFESSQQGGALDYAAFHFPALDSAFAVTRRATSDSTRRAAWRVVQERLRDSVPVAWVYHSRGVQGVSARLAGIHMDLRGELPTIASWESIGPPGTRAR